MSETPDQLPKRLPDKPPKKPYRPSLDPILWSCLIYLFGLVVLFIYFPKLQAYVGEVFGSPEQAPQYPILPILLYFFGVVIVMGVVLWKIPISKLRLVLKIFFGVFYTWGVFVLLSLILPFHLAFIPALVIALAAAAGWFFFSIVWLQNLLLVVTLVSIGGVFGALVPPWTIIIFLAAVSIYDILAVTLGYMMWMARKLSEADTLPAFIMPRKATQWQLNLRGSTVQKLFDEEASEREYSLLGGGDLGFPLIFVVSVNFHTGYNAALWVAGFSMLGLIFAYLLQIFLLKGKPLPALPPISFMCIVGYLVAVYLVH
jgi:presenilin-like A22 family membrane protease